MTATSSDPSFAMGRLVLGQFLMTASFEDARAGVLVRSVQPCADDPALICVAVRTGHPIEPIIRDARCFAISLVDPDDRLVVRKFSGAPHPEGDADPFDAIPTDSLTTGAPVLRRSALVFDCEVARHFDLEAESELYIGHVLACRATQAESGSTP